MAQKSFSQFIVVSFVFVVVKGGCPLECSCPPLPPACPPGVSWVTDACGCCKVCARQFNQDCSPSQPCDHIKGLHCHLGVSGDPDRGLCRADAMGRPCELDGRVYQHGEDFKPSCEHQCTCMDGVVGCMPLCPQQVPLPQWRCSRPRLARLPGRCCEEWLCDDDNHITEDSEEIRSSPPPAPPQPPSLNSNDLLIVPIPWDSSAGAPYQEWIPSTQSHALAPSTCFLQTTDWSPCSATCGMGISSRVTNSNPECQLARETRLCHIRQCDWSLTPTLKKGKKCQRTVRPHDPVHIHFAGCSTVQRYRPRSCGSCADGRCCTPSLTRTVRLHFRCPDERRGFTRSMMWIQRCQCTESCQARGLASPGSFRLPNDIHTYTS